MIRVSILYPAQEGSRFDTTYYTGRHLAMVREKLSPLGLQGTLAEKGIHGGAAGTPAPFHCIGHLLFKSVDDYKAAMKAHGKALAADIPNFTNVTPIIQVGEMVE
jgi:uncharacterized protein (TIGR02118 family)